MKNLRGRFALLTALLDLVPVRAHGKKPEAQAEKEEALAAWAS